MLKARAWRQWRPRDHVLVFGPALLVAGAAFAVAVNFVKPAPPRRIVLATGRPARGGLLASLPFLFRLVLPEGALSLERDVPPRDVVLLAAATSLVVRPDSISP